jgi:DNA-binding response OmpR family regulator
VVDDSDDAATSLSMLLKLFGHHTRVAHSGLQALTEVDDFQPNAVLLDIGLPDLDGWQVAQRLRASPSGRDCVLLALTGSDEPEDRRRSAEAGFDEHLVKPVEPEALLRRLAELLSRGPQARQRSRAVALSAHWS